MARIRTIKPEFWNHPVMGKLDDSAKCLALALLNFADDEGFFLAEPNLVRSSCRPFDDDSTIIRRCLATLVESEWITLKIHPTHGPIGHISKFSEHQHIDRLKPSTLKSYFLDDDSTNARRTIDDQSLREGKGMEGNGMDSTPLPPSGERSKEKGKRRLREVKPKEPSLEELLDGRESQNWKRYWWFASCWPKGANPSPRSLARAWIEACSRDDPKKIYAAALEYQKEFLPPKRRQDESQYMKSPLTWLKEEAWLNETNRDED